MQSLARPLAFVLLAYAVLVAGCNKSGNTEATTTEGNHRSAGTSKEELKSPAKASTQEKIVGKWRDMDEAAHKFDAFMEFGSDGQYTSCRYEAGNQKREGRGTYSIDTGDMLILLSKEEKFGTVISSRTKAKVTIDGDIMTIQWSPRRVVEYTRVKE